MRLAFLRDGDHGGLGPDVYRRVPVEAFYTASFDRDYIFTLQIGHQLVRDWGEIA